MESSSFIMILDNLVSLLKVQLLKSNSKELALKIDN